MRYLVLALALLPAAAIAGERDTPQPAPHAARPDKPATRCQNAGTDYARPGGAPARLRTLKQEPLAGQYLGVLRLQDGCDMPVQIADGVGDKQR